MQYVDPIAFENQKMMAIPKIKDNPDLIPKSHLVNHNEIESKLNSLKNPSNLKNVLFLNMTTEKAGYYAINHGFEDVILLNFGNRHRPGGGYLRGAKAQEEDLCRCFPQLYPSLKKTGAYPFDLRDVICTEPCICMRDSSTKDYNFLDESDQGLFYFVTAAAPNIRSGFEYFDSKKTALTVDNILLAPLMKFNVLNEKNKLCLVLGAWGCGAFGNDPNKMAEIMKGEIKKYGGYYDLIIFAVPSIKDTRNFKIFKNKFSQ